jgi:2-polyprenyl-3-methyl-5-hydroxy-6-metoxy-1,4-benzoquinol methylase
VNAAAASMLEILAYVEAELARGAESIELDVLDPDAGAHRYAGELVEVDFEQLIHRPLRVWVDLAERLRLRLRTPRPSQPLLLRLTFEKLDVDELVDEDDGRDAPRRDGTNADGARTDGEAPDGTEKYGARSTFARIRKLEDPTFAIDLREALDRVVESHAHGGTTGADSRAAPTNTKTRMSEVDAKTHVGTADKGSAPSSQIQGEKGSDPFFVRAAAPVRVLDLGVNTGDELTLLMATPALRDAQIVGVDHSASAIAVARERFAAHPNVRFVEANIMQLTQLELGRFDLVVCIGTLQSGALDDRELLRRIVQEHLTPNGAVILGMPNCRYVDGELEYGARIVNITQPELGLLVKDVAFYRKYLQQHHKRVFVTGKHYLFVTAIPT